MFGLNFFYDKNLSFVLLPYTSSDDNRAHIGISKLGGFQSTENNHYSIRFIKYLVSI
jgi:hypothetical protein